MCECACDAPEQAFAKGMEYMRKLILDRLYDEKRTAIGKDRFVITVIINIVEKIEV